MNSPGAQFVVRAQKPPMQLWVGPQAVHDGPHASWLDKWSEQASFVPSGRVQTNWPGGHDVRVVQTPLTQFCTAPQMAHDGPHAVRFEE